MFATYNTYTVPFVVKTCIFIVTHIQLPYSHCYRLFQIIQAVDSEQPSWASAGLAVSFWASAPRCFARCPANSWTSGIHTLAVTEPRKHMAKEELLSSHYMEIIMLIYVVNHHLNLIPTTVISKSTKLEWR